MNRLNFTPQIFPNRLYSNFGLGIRPVFRQRQNLTGGGGGWRGNGGSDGGGGGDDFDPRNFSLMAVLAMVSEGKDLKVPCYVIADIDEDTQEEVEENTYIKPAPKPKPESMSLKGGASWLLLLLLLSGGVFMWRRMRKPSNPEGNEADDIEMLRQQQRDIDLDELQQDQPPAEAAAPAPPADPAPAPAPAPEQENELEEEEEEEGLVVEGQMERIEEEIEIEDESPVLKSNSPAPDFEKALSTQDELFDIEREVSISSQPSGVEKYLSTEFSEKLDELETEETQEDESTVPAFDTSPPTPIGEVEDPAKKNYFEDLEIKDSIFEAADDAEAESTVNLKLLPSEESPGSVNVQLGHPEYPPEEDTKTSERSALSPKSHEGSSQSATTQFTGPSDSQENAPPQIPEVELDVDVYNPMKYADIDLDEDLGPPVKPSAVDFTKPSPVEEEGLSKPKTQPIQTDDKIMNMQYLLSNADLLSKAMRAMESDPTTESPQALKQSRSSKRRSRKSKKKKSS